MPIVSKGYRRIAAAAVISLVVGSKASAESLNTQLYEAARDGDAGSVQALLDQGANPNSRYGWKYIPLLIFQGGKTSLCAAAENGHADVIRLLVKKGADVRKRCGRGFGDAIPLIFGGYDPGLSPLQLAVQDDQVDAAKALLEGSPDAAIEAVEHPGRGWLHVLVVPVPAAEGGRVVDSVDLSASPLAPIARVILESIGANPDADQQDRDAIVSALRNENTNAVKWAAAKSWGDHKPAAGAGVASKDSDLDEQIRHQESSIVSDVDFPRFDQRPESDKDLAVIVGVSRYQLPLPEAKFAERDALTVAKYLRQLGVAPSRMKVLIGDKATNGALKLALDHWLPENVKPGSTVYFYFSGHGAPNIEDKSAYIVPWDGDPSGLDDTALSLSSVYKRLGALGAKHTLVALDSCFSGAGGRSVVVNGARPLVVKLSVAAIPSDLTVMTASGADQITQADDAAGHGLFTYYLLSGLNAGLSDVQRLCGYLTPKVQDNAALAGESQKPVCSGPDFSLR